jgi:hypothetical protein
MTESLYKIGFGLWGILEDFRVQLEERINEDSEPKGSPFYIMCEFFGVEAIPSGPYLEILPAGIVQFEEDQSVNELVESFHLVNIDMLITLKNFGSNTEFIRQNLAASYVVTKFFRKGRFLPFAIDEIKENGMSLQIKDLKESQLFISEDPGNRGFRYGQEISCLLHFNVKGK